MELQDIHESLRKRETQSPTLKRPHQPFQSQDSPTNSTNLDDTAKPDHFQLLFPSTGDSDNQNKRLYKSSNISQLKALMYKNASLQSQQKGTNICQILTPIICLVVTLLVKVLAQAKMQNTYTVDMEFPYFYNVPYHTLYNNTPSPLEFSTCLQFYLFDFENATKKTKDFVLGNGKNGLLNKTIPSFEGSQNIFRCEKYDTVMPYFQLPDDNNTINEHIYENLLHLNNQTFRPKKDLAGLDILPDGAVTFYEANRRNLSAKIQINDLRLPEYHRANGVSKFNVKEKMPLYSNGSNISKRQIVTRVVDGQLIMLDLLGKAYLQKINPKVLLLSGSQYMPISTSEGALVLKVIGVAGASLYPIALSILLPVFLYTFILEKEERLREMMKMNGLKVRNYWIVNYFWNLGLYIVSTFIFFIFGRYILNVPFFTETSPAILVVILFGWGLSQVSLSFFYQNFLSKARTATIVGYILSLWTTIIGITLNSGVYPFPQLLPTGLRLYPPFAFCRLIYGLSIKCGGVGCLTKYSALDQEAVDCITSLYLGAVVFLILGLYLDAVLPQQYGVAEHPLFFLPKWLKPGNRSKKSAKVEHGLISNENEDGDMDVTVENEIVKNIQPTVDKYPLIIKNLRKVYKAVGGRPPKVAVKDLSLHIKKGEMFGLLGPNGAGKTSLISMLTGLYSPEAGNAWVGGYDIVNQIDYVHTQMGVCPQFDLLWPDLAVEDHLLFYARIRGVPKRDEKKVVERAMAEVYLTRFALFKVCQLSGGMKRRLSVAISLVGDPQIVFLDEPTTGLDPENRRRLWDILVEARGNRAMVLTTHSMEEADVLCTRIGIITGGSLKCIGPQTRLKSRYGNGYHLSINCHRDKYFNQNVENQGKCNSAEMSSQEVQTFVKKFLPKAILKSAFNGNFIYLVPLEGLEISTVFKEFEKRKIDLGISDWGISQSSLEDVFMEVVGDSEARDENIKN